MNIPEELKALPQFVAWREEIRDGKPAKVPIDAKNGHKAAVDRLDTWASFAVALAAVSGNGNLGLGFVLTAADPYTVIDLDKCRNPETGEIEAWAWKIIRQLYSFTEISPSGAGVHIWVRGKLPPGGRRKGRFEAYSDKRYLTLTGLHLEGTPATIEAKQAELETLHREIFGQEKKETPKPGPSPNQEPSDRMVIEKACAARNGEKFSRLWAGNWQGRLSISV